MTNASKMSFDLPDLETDGRRVSSSLDPPGQRCVYIPPGFPENEAYRLSTFKNFPTNVPVDPCQLAANGFYFTGYQDRVKCFSCGQAVDSWVVGDEPKSPNWHQPGCDFMKGTDKKDIPLRKPRSNQKRVSLDLVRHPEGDNTSERRQRQIYFTAREESVASESEPRAGNSRKVCTRKPQHRIFPCRNPINPHMRRKEDRLQTFIDRSHIWPYQRISSTPDKMVDAGMFYLGERDCVKCWYCNGGLQNWEFNDDPWTEHAKYFPMCEYVLQRKGVDFVSKVVTQFPNLSRPQLQNASKAAPVKHLSTLIDRNSRLCHSPPPVRKFQRHIAIVDPQEELCKERVRQIQDEAVQSVLVDKEVVIGFESRNKSEVLKTKQEKGKPAFHNAESSFKAQLSLLEIHEEITSKTFPSTPAPQPSDNALPDQEWQLRESRKCKICKKQLAVMVFVPCGHLTFCRECERQAKVCPIFRTLIR